MRIRGIRVLGVILAAVLFLAGCGRQAGIGAGNANGTITGNSPENGFRIVTSFYPVYVATINVTRDIPGVTVKNMTKPQTGCLHDYALKPDDLKILEKADAFVINGAGMEAFLDDVIKQQNSLKIVEASKGIPLITDSNGEKNAHVWVSITNEITYIKNISEQLAALDTVNAERYSENASEYIQKLESLKNELHAKLDGVKKRDIITFHEAFPYFAREFNLNIAAVIEREPGSDPKPRELGGIIDQVEATGIKALFAEPQYSSKAADVISRETGAKVYTLDPVVTGDPERDSASYDAYLTAMEQNGNTLLEALK